MNTPLTREEKARKRRIRKRWDSLWVTLLNFFCIWFALVVACLMLRYGLHVI